MSGDSQTTRVELSYDKQVARLLVSFPERRNPIGTETAALIGDRLLEVEANPEARAIVITGDGDSCSSGGDLREFLATTSALPTDHWETGGPWGRLYTLLRTVSKPTICRVHGPAMAGGCGIVASCDFAIASDISSFATPEAKIGLFPLFILPSLIRAIGRRNAVDMCLTGRIVQAPEAAAMGLINRCVPLSELDGEVDALAAQLAAIGPLTMKMGKRSFNEIAEMDFAHGIETARAMRIPFMGSPELQEGISKFLAKSGAKPRG